MVSLSQLPVEILFDILGYLVPVYPSPIQTRIETFSLSGLRLPSLLEMYFLERQAFTQLSFVSKTWRSVIQTLAVEVFPVPFSLDLVKLRPILESYGSHVRTLSIDAVEMTGGGTQRIAAEQYNEIVHVLTEIAPALFNIHSLQIHGLIKSKLPTTIFQQFPFLSILHWHSRLCDDTFFNVLVSLTDQLEELRMDCWSSCGCKDHPSFRQLMATFPKSFTRLRRVEFYHGFMEAEDIHALLSLGSFGLPMTLSELKFHRCSNISNPDLIDILRIPNLDRQLQHLSICLDRRYTYSEGYVHFASTFLKVCRWLKDFIYLNPSIPESIFPHIPSTLNRLTIAMFPSHWPILCKEYKPGDLFLLLEQLGHMKLTHLALVYHSTSDMIMMEKMWGKDIAGRIQAKAEQSGLRITFTECDWHAGGFMKHTPSHDFWRS
ncbi:hypothetical protein D9758_004140 [Tetrapyrgos nigripes]|uniref:F-box domain-containing protein n=1 Tax=Tetrapyrgos nigripes TaxID=182062 RepID=A0A8H5GUJ6_9AGAR|nr:hypothetical protein D9758_004140 [Tetrapyrgos nigripes]